MKLSIYLLYFFYCGVRGLSDGCKVPSHREPRYVPIIAWEATVLMRSGCEVFRLFKCSLIAPQIGEKQKRSGNYNGIYGKQNANIAQAQASVNPIHSVLAQADEHQYNRYNNREA